MAIDTINGSTRIRKIVIFFWVFSLAETGAV
jgi:hypothetical protein